MNKYNKIRKGKNVKDYKRHACTQFYTRNKQQGNFNLKR